MWNYPEVSAKPKSEMRGHTGTIEDVDVSADEKYIVTTADDRVCKIWRASTGECLSSFSWKSENGTDNLTIKCPHFFGKNHVLLSAAGSRGPARLGCWKFLDDAGNKVAEPEISFEATIDPKPCSAMKLNKDRTLLCCGFVTGNKSV